MLSYAERASLASHPLAARLFTIMEAKKTNLCVAADVTDKQDLLRIADELGDKICALKTHIDIIKNFDEDLTAKLQELARQHDYLIFEDRKFADIGNTVKEQYAGGVYHIAQWAHLVNAHVLPGPGIIKGLKEIGQPLKRGLLLLAQMSSQGALTNDEYARAAAAMAQAQPDFVMGFIAQKRLVDEPGFITMTPGVQLNAQGDQLGQQYNTPALVIGQNHSDIIIVGRGIIKADDMSLQAEKYRQAGWEAYQDTLSR